VRRRCAGGGGSFDPADYLGIARAFGATDVLPKPFRPADLVAIVARLLAVSPSAEAPKAVRRD